MLLFILNNQQVLFLSVWLSKKKEEKMLYFNLKNVYQNQFLPELKFSWYTISIVQLIYQQSQKIILLCAPLL